MTQTLYKKEDPLNLGGGWSSSQAPPGTWSSRPRRRKGAPIYKAKRQYRHRRRAGYAASRKQPKHQHGRSPWFWPPAQHCWPAGPNWGLCAGPWLPPPVAFPKLPCPAQMRRLYGTPSLCACCCSCWWRPWHPGWAWPPGARKRRWGRRSHLRRPRRHPPVDLNSLLRPVNLYGWRAPGMRAPPNTTQYIMNQVYEDMRQQELQERQQGPGWDVPSPGDPAGRGAPCSGGEEDPGLPGALYGLEHDPSLLLSPAPVEKSQSPPSQLLGEEERNEGEGDEYEEEVCDGEEEEEEVEEEEEESVGDEATQEEEEEEEEEQEEEETPGQKAREAELPLLREVKLEKEERMEGESQLPLEMPLSFLLGAEGVGDDFLNYPYFSPDQMFPEMPEDALFKIPDVPH